MANNQRIKRVQTNLAAWKVDGVVVSSPANIRYLSGFTGSNGLLWIGEKEARLLTDGRYTTQAKTECAGRGVKVQIVQRSGEAGMDQYKGMRMGFEDQRISFLLAERLRNLGKLVALGDALDRLRLVKDAAEIAAIRASVDLNARALKQVLRKFRAEQTEAELAAKIDYTQRTLGAEGTAFSTIVASGAHSALPHAQPRTVALERNGFLLIDMGACREGYMSDMTRTYGLGRVEREQQDVYAFVLEAQLAAIDRVAPGVAVSEVHAAAAGVLKRAKLDKLFVHSTGHGLGLEIHEAPRIADGETTVLEPGMVITIEPGVYRPGKGGVRIEDTVLVGPRGAEILTPLTIAPKQWTIVS
ncbi:MAG: Xaa-Pro peptidase family protein [Bryobacter sp.]